MQQLPSASHAIPVLSIAAPHVPARAHFLLFPAVRHGLLFALPQSTLQIPLRIWACPRAKPHLSRSRPPPTHAAWPPRPRRLAPGSGRPGVPSRRAPNPLRPLRPSRPGDAAPAHRGAHRDRRAGPSGRRRGTPSESLSAATPPKLATSPQIRTPRRAPLPSFTLRNAHRAAWPPSELRWLIASSVTLPGSRFADN